MVNFNSLLSGDNLAFRTASGASRTLRCQLAATGASEFTLQGADGSEVCSLLNVNNLGCAQIGGHNLSDYARYSYMQDHAITLGTGSQIDGYNILTTNTLSTSVLNLGGGSTIGGHAIATYDGLATTTVDLEGNSTLDGSRILSFDNIGTFGALNLASDATVGGVQIASSADLANAIQGIDWKQEVEVYFSGSVTVNNPGTAVFDGVTLTSGQRILIVDNGVNSGIWVFNSSSSAMSRATDMNSAAECAGAAVYVKQGTQAATAWTCSSFTTVADPSTFLTDFSTFELGTHIPSFAQFAGATLFTAGDGITRSGQVLSVNQATNFTWTGTHTFQNTVDLSGSSTRALSVATNMNTYTFDSSSSRFNGFHGTITDNSSGGNGVKQLALNRFSGGTVVGNHASNGYYVANVLVEAPTVSGTYGASMLFGLLVNANSLFNGTITQYGAFTTDNTMTAHDIAVGGNFTVNNTGVLACHSIAVATNKFTVGNEGNVSTDGSITTSLGLSAASAKFTVNSSTAKVLCGDIDNTAISGGGRVDTGALSAGTGSFSTSLSSSGLISSTTGFKVTVSSVDQFTVDASGNTWAKGTLSSDGSFSVATNKFTVNASTGAVSMASGELTVSNTGALAGLSGVFSTTLSVGTGEAFYVDTSGNATGASLTSSSTLSVGPDDEFHVSDTGAITKSASVYTTGAVTCGSVSSSGAVSGTAATFSSLSCASGSMTVNGSTGYIGAPFADFTDGLQAGVKVAGQSPFRVDNDGVTWVKALTATHHLAVGTMTEFYVNSSGAITACASATVSGDVGCGSMTSTGAVSGTTGTFTGAVAGATFESTSDQRLKTDVTVVESEGDRFDQLRPVTFVWTEGSQIQNNQDEQGQVQKQWGFLAQEVGEVYHDLLRGNSNKFGLAYDGFFAILVAEVQALRRRTASLESQLAAAAAAFAPPATL